MADHVPEGFSALTPFLHVDDAEGFITWAKEALGAEERFVHREDGRVVHGEIYIEGCVLELSEGRDKWPGRPASFHLYVSDPDASVARALEVGGEVLYEVADQEYGERSGGVADPFGNNWYFARVTDPARRSPNLG